MSSVDIKVDVDLLARLGGWEVVKQARTVLASGKVLSSNYTPPVLKGVVQEGGTSYRAGLVLPDLINVENLCSCRASKQWGTICVHSVAVGLHYCSPAVYASKPSEVKASISSVARDKNPTPSTPAPKSHWLEAGPGVTPIELAVIFPPNIDIALDKGKVMVCFEALTPTGRAPLNTLSSVPKRSLSSADASLGRFIDQMSGLQLPAMLMLDLHQFSALLETLRGHSRLTLGRSTPLSVPQDSLRLHVTANLESDGEVTVSAVLPANVKLLSEGSTFARNLKGFVHFGLPVGWTSLLKSPKRLTRREIPIFLNRDFPLLAAVSEFSANFAPGDFSLETTRPAIELNLRGGLANLDGFLSFVYGNHRIAVGSPEAAAEFYLPIPDRPKAFFARDWDAETAANQRLLRSQFTGPHAEGKYQLAGQNAVLNFFARDYQRLLREWKVILEERLEQSTVRNLEVIEPEFKITGSGEQWFDVSVDFQGSSGQKFNPAEIQRLLRSGQGHMKLPSGKFAIMDVEAVDELQQVLVDANPQQHAGGYRLKASQSGFLQSTLAQSPGWKVQAPPSWLHRAGPQASGLVDIKIPPLGDLEEILRPYQKQGVGWMHFLRENRFAGILADEMGLGKTLQALAYLGSRSPHAERKPSLIVCPKSLVFNWLSEAARFTPNLKVVALDGSNRGRLFESAAQADLIITSYGLIKRDAAFHADTEYDTVVLDEAQHIKNRQTQNAQSVKTIRAEHRLVLTGTPLENSVLDLWSIFDFLMPGYLGTAKDFKERYEMPISRDRDLAVQSRLSRRVRPFLLRRLKKDVAKDLPARIEQIAHCELNEVQAALYQQMLEAGRQEVDKATGAGSQPGGKLVVLNALLRLRQICCDPRLLKLDSLDPTERSGKFDIFLELLEEAIDGGHRVLVFSQFVSMLTLLREELDRTEIPYCYLDGSTNDRGAVVKKFQEDANIPVFLISLKAGGVGLNLTAADTVIHFDPWWNPAVEDQATDRAHRIGQQRIVTSYKLITRGTVEEKILRLQEKKRQIIRATLSDEQQFAESLTWDEISDLFA